MKNTHTPNRIQILNNILQYIKSVQEILKYSITSSKVLEMLTQKNCTVSDLSISVALQSLQTFFSSFPFSEVLFPLKNLSSHNS